ncbi:HPt domain-containing protein [Lachancea thermotolerans]|uniref:KLTH0B08030p n=1 Tax=Lachancea thermotolerans (strain ATCC 56472 / CBS 6340 / NRRL Y-8284) TaxID=559295 RepID=C5DD38_LACTC|nr:KLTH0B08030p [Lachancea thermotolerans CBS 6340]CAR21699.1 KLTH0B08030p [Lachancea thermotolerans CBS 6340]
MNTVPIPAGVINWNTLNEIVSMDEDSPDFSKNLIIQYLEQANTTFDQIEQELQGNCDLEQLASLGHFLRGSSAALGLQRISWACERIQNLGRKREGGVEGQQLPDSHYAQLITNALQCARNEFKAAKAELSAFYKSEL